MRRLEFLALYVFFFFSATAQVSLDYINDFRFRCGLMPFIHDAVLERAAHAHAVYMADNDTLVHYEQPGRPGFTGKTPGDRAIYFGYPTRYVVEDAALVYSPLDAIDGLFAAPYHRVPLLSFDLDLIGFSGEKDYFAMEFSNSYLVDICNSPHKNIQVHGRYYSRLCRDSSVKVTTGQLQEALDQVRKANPEVVFFPYNRQTDVSVLFYNEWPAPVPGCSVNGYPVSIFFNPFYFDSVEMIKFIVKDNKGHKVIPARILTASNDDHKKLSPFQFFFIPKDPLMFNTTYQVKFVARVDGRKRSFSWKFSTRNVPDIIYWRGNMTVTAQPEDLLNIFIVPKDCNDTHFSLKYRYNIDKFSVELQNRFFIIAKINGQPGEQAEIFTSDGRKITIVIK